MIWWNTKYSLDVSIKLFYAVGASSIYSSFYMVGSYYIYINKIVSDEFEFWWMNFQHLKATFSIYLNLQDRLIDPLTWMDPPVAGYFFRLLDFVNGWPVLSTPGGNNGVPTKVYITSLFDCIAS
jgi:hypothetical protein